MNIDFSKIWKKLSGGTTESSSILVQYRERDWKLLMTYFVLVIFLVFGIGGYLFLQMKASIMQSAGIVGTESNRVLLNVDSLDRALASFQSKSAKFEAYRQQPPHIADPAL
jgi:hypothetical protein